jgi:hypothetical protein
MEQNLNRLNDRNRFATWELKRSSFINVELIDVKPATEQEEKEKRELLILCRFCSSNITSPKNIIEVNGKPRHTFANPAGNTFTIGCFSSAGGCLNLGIPTTEYTWFPGHSWCYAMCSECSSHLGWHYQSADGSFYGLILNNLIENI